MDLAKDPDALETIATKIFDFAMARGVVMQMKEKLPKRVFKHLPVTLLPCPVLKEDFDHVESIQPHINTLMHLISRDPVFINKHLSKVSASDEFTKSLLDIYNETFESTKNLATLGILRTDYMIDFTEDKLSKPNHKKYPQQVEINTICVGLCANGSTVITDMYRTVLNESPFKEIAARIPNNDGLDLIGKGLARAWQEYGRPKAVLVFFVDSFDFNICDQRALEYAVYRYDPNIIVRRRIFNDIVTSCELGSEGELLVNGEETAVAYFRSGYSPRHYPTKRHWEARLLIEKSKAIKSPNVAQQLVGSKKIQEVLSRPGMIEHYLKDEHISSEIRKTFAGLYSLEMTEDGDNSVLMAIRNPENYVLKPQREGGGNNLYNDDIVARLTDIGKDDRRCAYILMDKISPSGVTNHILNEEDVKSVDIVGEIGIFGVYLANGKFIENYSAGYMLRSKPCDLDEGGVAIGNGAITAPYFI